MDTDITGRIGILRHLLAAEGYLELDMPKEALVELNEISRNRKNELHPLRLRLRALIGLEDWAPCVTLAASAAKRFPEEGEFFLQWAYALHKSRPADVRNVINAAPESLKRSGFLQYNLARFEAQDGNFDVARSYLREAFQLNPVMALNARRDPDLKAIWN